MMDRDEVKTRAAEIDRLRHSIFARCRELGFGDEERREVQLRATGKESLTSMTADEMRAVVRALGGGMPNRSGLPRNAHAAKLRALWISAFWLGVVRDRSDQALGAWVCRQSGLAAARWATPAHTAAAIEALKEWMAREAGVDWSPYGAGRSKAHHCPGGRVLEALWRKLHAANAVRDPAPAALDAWVVGYRRSPERYMSLPAGALNQLIARLGAWLKESSA